jgi:type I restriction enzyme M protein
VDAPKFKDYLLRLIFLKRVSDVFEDEIRAGALHNHPEGTTP